MWPFTKSFPEVAPDALFEEYDYIIVGGGTAGCVLASRLSEDPNVTVLVIERGIVGDTWQSRVPLMSADFLSKNATSYKWNCTPQSNLNGSQYLMVAGKALGGGSRVNAMLYTRGYPAEYNAWARAGRKGWSFNEIESIFHRSERALGSLATEPHHGKQGVWSVQQFSHFFFKGSTETIKAAKSLNLPFIYDINSPKEPIAGCAELHVTINAKGQRDSTFTAFLPTSLALSRRERLHMCTGMVVQKIDIKPGGRQGLKACGVYFEAEVSNPSPKRHYVQARREIIVCSGAIASPQLLMLSGIGPKDHLQSKGIDVILDHAGVGQHLQDHFGVSVTYGVPLAHSLHHIAASIFVALWHLFLYFIFTTGHFLSPITQVSLFTLSSLLDPKTSKVVIKDPSQLDAHQNIPDIEVMAVPNNTTDAGGEIFRGKGIFSYLAMVLQPKSKGTIELASKDARDRPICNPKYLSDPEGIDRNILYKALKLSSALGEQVKQQGYTFKDIYVPSTSSSSTELDKFILQHARTSYHYSSTCRMAPFDDPVSPGVVDDELRVYGVDRLRVADASVFPQIVAGHLQAPTVLVAEKCADMVKEAHCRTGCGL